VLIVISYYQQKPANSMAATVSKAIIKWQLKYGGVA
jgi:hypothetical protein